MLGIGLSTYVPIIIYIIGIFAVFIAIFHKVEYALYFTVPLLPLQNVMERIHELPFGKDFIDILFLSMIIGLIRQSSVRGDRLIPKTPFNVPIIILMIITFLGILKGQMTLTGNLSVFLDNPQIQYYKNFILMPILYFIVVNAVRDLKSVKVLILLMFLAMIPMDFYFFSTFRWLKQWHYTHDMRFSGAFVYLGPNELAAFYAQYSFIILSIFLFDTVKINKLLYLGVFAMNMYCILFLYSRTAYIACILGFFFIGAFQRRKYLVLLLLFIACWTFVVPTSVQERIYMTENDEGALDPSSQGRLDLWKYGLKLFKENPVFGVGVGAYHVLAKSADRYERTRDPHNMYIKVLAEMGLIGFIIYLFLYYLCLKIAWRLYQSSPSKWAKGLGFGFFICVILNMFMNIFHDVYSYIILMGFYWVFLGLIVRLNFIFEEESKKTVKKIAP